jgi:NAD+ kinase
MPNNVHTVGIISKPRPQEVRTALTGLLAWLRSHDLDAVVDLETAEALGTTSGIRREEFPDPLDLVVVVGGDGTLLSATRALAGRDIPVLAVNLGSLGFLTSITLDQMYPMLERVLTGRFEEERRRMLQVSVNRDDETVETYHPLNDVVINKAAIARILDFEVLVDGQDMSTYKADGLILSTPTGSTAYSLAAGGPVIYPAVHALLITPICSHTLNHRPLVLPDHSTVEVVVHSGGESVHLTADGQLGMPLHHGDRVVCRRSPRTLRLIRPQSTGYFEILRNKLSWGQR